MKSSRKWFERPRALEGVDESRAFSRSSGLRIALLSPYSGKNLGDAAIHESVIESLQEQCSDLELVSLSPDPEGIARRHGIAGVSIVGRLGPFRIAPAPLGVPRVERPLPPVSATQTAEAEGRGREEPVGSGSAVRRLLKRLPLMGRIVRGALRVARACWDVRHEPLHLLRSALFARRCDLIVVCGGGQFDEQWGGPCSHPYVLFRWALLSRAVGTPFAIASVGVGQLHSRLGRAFCRAACRLASYRSFREVGSLELIREWKCARSAHCVPDLALNLPRRVLSASVEPRKRHVAVSPIPFGRRGTWSTARQALYERYLRELASFTQRLFDAGYEVSFFTSSLDDRVALDELLDLVHGGRPKMQKEQFQLLPCQTSRQLVGSLATASFVVASRLHGVILAHSCHCPTLAISFERKVDAEMSRVGHDRYRLDISTVQADDLWTTFEALAANDTQLREELASNSCSVSADLHRQYEALLSLARGRFVEVGATRRA